MTNHGSHLCNARSVRPATLNVLHVGVEVPELVPRRPEDHDVWHVAVGAGVGPVVVLVRTHALRGRHRKDQGRLGDAQDGGPNEKGESLVKARAFYFS